MRFGFYFIIDVKKLGEILKIFFEFFFTTFTSVWLLSKYFENIVETLKYGKIAKDYSKFQFEVWELFLKFGYFNLKFWNLKFLYNL